MSPKKIRRTLAERRERLDMTQADVALAMAKPVHWVGGAERGRMSNKTGRELRIFILRMEVRHRYIRMERSRIARGRALWTQLPETPGKAAILEWLECQAWQALDEGSDADRLLECLPEWRADKLMDEFFEDVEIQ